MIQYCQIICLIVENTLLNFIFIKFYLSVNFNFYERSREYMKINKELRKLKRVELLEIMVALSEENQLLRSKIKSLEKKLTDRSIKINESGSIAEAALKISDIFKSAQDAADLYLENIKQTHFNSPNSNIENSEP